MSSRSVLIRWGYVTSQIMRDLTIRSDPAFGAFQILKLFLDDWISLTVLRTVALSTNSVAASVEPVMQQQFFTLSPLAGQDGFPGALDRAAHSLMATHTPTTTSMLAALNDPFPPGSLDPSGGAFNPNNYFMETSPTAHGDAFADFHGVPSNPFDVGGFSHELNLPPHQELSPAKESESEVETKAESESVKEEASSTA